MPLEAALLALAALAGNTVVTAAVTDAWEAARKGFARLLGRGDPAKTKLAEERLAETHDQLTQAPGAELERVRAALEAQWVTRLTDLLEEDPGVEADLRALVEEVQAQLPAGMVSAADHAVAAGRDVNISASGGWGGGRGNPRECRRRALPGRARRIPSRARVRDVGPGAIAAAQGRDWRSAGWCSPAPGGGGSAGVAAAPAGAAGRAGGAAG